MNVVEKSRVYTFIYNNNLIILGLNWMKYYNIRI